MKLKKIIKTRNPIKLQIKVIEGSYYLRKHYYPFLKFYFNYFQINLKKKL